MFVLQFASTIVIKIKLKITDCILIPEPNLANKGYLEVLFDGILSWLK